jgi:ribokinase
MHIKPVDTTGAGDSFDAGFIYYYLYENKGLKASMEFANALGALSCLYIGGAEQRITETDILDFMSHQKLGGKKN